jgi:hypothetical protein
MTDSGIQKFIAKGQNKNKHTHIIFSQFVSPDTMDKKTSHDITNITKTCRSRRTRQQRLTNTVN